MHFTPDHQRRNLVARVRKKHPALCAQYRGKQPKRGGPFLPKAVFSLRAECATPGHRWAPTLTRTAQRTGSSAEEETPHKEGPRRAAQPTRQRHRVDMPSQPTCPGHSRSKVGVCPGAARHERGYPGGGRYHPGLLVSERPLRPLPPGGGGYTGPPTQQFLLSNPDHTILEEQKASTEGMESPDASYWQSCGMR